MTWSCSRPATTKKVLGEINMGNAVYTTPVAKDGVLYIATRSRLFALKNGVKSKSLAEWDKANAAAMAPPAAPPKPQG